MTTFDARGRMTSCFVPPTDEHGQVLSYAAWRARAGIPIGPEEAAAKAEVIRLAHEYHATQRPRAEGERWEPNEAFLRLEAAERRVSEIAGPLYRAYEERRRSDMGCPRRGARRPPASARRLLSRRSKRSRTGPRNARSGTVSP